MRKRFAEATLLALFMLVVTASAGRSSETSSLDTAEIERLTSLSGTFDEKRQVYKLSAPRNDLRVVASGVHLTPPMGLTSWVAFQRVGARTMIMGDLVLEENQVSPVMRLALDNDLEVTALHNHFLFESPVVMFMHVSAVGEEAKLASAVGKVFAAIRQTAGSPAAPRVAEIDPAKSTLDPDKLDAVLRTKGAFKDGVYKAVFGRVAKMHGHEVGGAMGVNTWAAFAGSEEKAAVDGDFAMLEPELQSVLKKLCTAGIDVVAIHQHMAGEEPRILFLHYWGIGNADALAHGVRSALDLTRTK